MHNFNVAQAKSMGQVHTQLMSLEKNLSEDMYHYPVPLRDMEDAGRAVAATFVVGGLTAGALALPPFWELTEAAGNLGVQFYVPRHPRWLNGLLYMTAHYTMDIGGGTVRWDIAGSSIADGGALPARTLAFVDIAAPAAADEWDVKDIVDSTLTTFHIPVTTEHAGTIFMLGRRPALAADTATGDVRLHKVVVHYMEAKREMGEKY